MKSIIITTVALVLAMAIAVFMGIEVAGNEYSSKVTGGVVADSPGASGNINVSPNFPPWGEWRATLVDLPYYRTEIELVRGESLDFPMPNVAVMKGIFTYHTTLNNTGTPNDVYLTLVMIDNPNSSDAGGDKLIVCNPDGTSTELEGIDLEVYVINH